MPAGACVLRYRGKRATTWRLKYIDASGRQRKETLGREPEWNRRKAKAELRARLVAVAKEGYFKPQALTLAAFAERFINTTCPLGISRPRR